MILLLLSRLRSVAQLVRLPNVFTALADIGLAALAGRSLSGEGFEALPAHWWLTYGWLCGATACLYSAGMVWNDFFDVAQDRRERPGRPIPAGRVSRRWAGTLGVLLLAGGLGCAFLAGWRDDGEQLWGPIIFAGLLIAAIFLYDAWLKHTWAGPIGMGLCRFLNVLLGFSVLNLAWGVYPASVVGLYIVGVTWFARTEARESNRHALIAAAVVMLVSLLMALPMPAPLPAGTSSFLFPYLLVSLGFLVGVPVSRAIARPMPAQVQSAVKSAIFGLVVLDAVLATALAGHMGLVLLLLLLPALYLGRWIYST